MTDNTLTTLPPDTSPEEAFRVMQRDGGVIIKDVAGPETLEALWQDLTPYFEGTAAGQDEFSGKQTRRVGGMLAKTRHIFPLLDHPVINGIAERFLAIPRPGWFGDIRYEMAGNYRLGVTQGIQIHPGQGFQPLHRDDALFQWEHPAFGREARVQTMIALSDFTEENGATRVIPGSHAWDDERAPSQDEAVSAEMAAGSALIWLGSTFHGGGLNSSNAPRTGLTFAYDLGFLRQEENQYLTVPLESVKTFPESIQRKMGYAACPPLMGFVELDGVLTDPMALLKKDDMRNISDLEAMGAVQAQ